MPEKRVTRNANDIASDNPNKGTMSDNVVYDSSKEDPLHAATDTEDGQQIGAEVTVIERKVEEKIDYEVLENISPNKELDDALNKQKETEKHVFESLINENVKLERELRKQDESFNQLNAKYDVKCIELEALRSKTADLEHKVADMENQIRILSRARKNTENTKSPNKGRQNKGKNVEPVQSSVDVMATTEEWLLRGGLDDSGGCHNDIDRKKYEEKIKDLQIRLMRLAEDDEDKSRKLSEAERDLDENRKYTEALEGHVDKDVREQLASEVHDTKRDTGFESWGKQTNFVYLGKPQTYNQKDKTQIKDSVVCSIS